MQQQHPEQGKPAEREKINIHLIIVYLMSLSRAKQNQTKTIKQWPFWKTEEQNQVIRGATTTKRDRRFIFFSGERFIITMSIVALFVFRLLFVAIETDYYPHVFAFLRLRRSPERKIVGETIAFDDDGCEEKADRPHR